MVFRTANRVGLEDPPNRSWRVFTVRPARCTAHRVRIGANCIGTVSVVGTRPGAANRPNRREPRSLGAVQTVDDRREATCQHRPSLLTHSYRFARAILASEIATLWQNRQSARSIGARIAESCAVSSKNDLLDQDFLDIDGQKVALRPRAGPFVRRRSFDESTRAFVANGVLERELQAVGKPSREFRRRRTPASRCQQTLGTME